MRQDFSRSPLVRLLDGWTPMGTPDRREDIAERLSPWLGVADAVRLHAAHQSIRPGSGAAAGTRRRGTATALRAQVQRVRADLEQSFTAGAPPRNQQTTGQPDDGFAVHLARYQDHQRQMAVQIEALRGQARRALAQAGPALSQLAEMDAVLEQLLGPREHKLLGTLPALLERRHGQLRSQPAANDAEAAPPPDWAATFEHDMQAALRAELDARLQPVLGLLEALEHELGEAHT